MQSEKAGIKYTLNIQKNNVVLLFLVFVIVYMWGIQWAGLNTLGNSLETHMQFLDLQLLKEKPFKSLLYMHSQPPLLNLIAWLLAIIFPDLYIGFIITNIACTFIIGLIVYKVTFYYLDNLKLSIGLTVFFLLSPSVILNTAYPFYPILTALGYAVLVYSFFIVKEQRLFSVLIFSVAIIYLSLLRSSFSILHAIFFLILYFFYTRKNIPLKWMVRSAFIILILIAVVPVKNYFLYGFFGSSSWAPLNLAKGFGIGDEIGPFPTSEKIRLVKPELSCKKSYGIQDNTDIKANGNINFNSCYLIEYAKVRSKDVIKQYNFEMHLSNIKKYIWIYFSPPDKYIFLQNRIHISSYANMMNGFMMSASIDGHEIRLLILLILFAAIYFSFVKKDKFLLLLLIVFFTHFFSHVLLDGEESNRFVFDIEFLFYILVAIVIKFSNLTTSKEEGNFLQF